MLQSDRGNHDATTNDDGPTTMNKKHSLVAIKTSGAHDDAGCADE